MRLFHDHSHSGDFLPKTVTVLRQGYSLAMFSKDLVAGLIVGVVALPLALGFAIASGATPEQGLYTAIVAGFIVSLLGGSRYQIGGPTGAFVIIILNVINKHGYEGLVITTLMAGAILLIFGIFRFGALIKYIPYPVTTGFTAGIAVLIFSLQMKDLFGLSMPEVPGEFFQKWAAYFHSADTLHLATLGLSALVFIAMLAVRRSIPRIPAPLVGVLLGGLLVWIFGMDVETIGSRFGGVPSNLPSFRLPTGITLERIQTLLPDALTIALLAGIESLLSAVVADGMTGDKHNSNVELTAQGAANIASVLFGGIPATGAIARTVTNIRSGGKTPIAGMIHALTLVAFILVLAPLASFIPLASLAVIMVFVSWDMSDLPKFLRLFRAPKSDVSIMCLTFILTIVVDLTVAVYVGVLLAAILFMRRMSDVTQVVALDNSHANGCETLIEHIEHVADVPHLAVPDGVQVYEIDGPFFFGVADRFQSVISTLKTRPRIFILRMNMAYAIDSTGINALESFHDRCVKNGSLLLLSGVRPKALRVMRRMGTLARIGGDNVCPTVDRAIERAVELMAEQDNKTEGA